MVVENASDVAKLGKTASSRPAFRRVLMAAPDFFRVEYAINPYMTDQAGKLNQVDSRLAKAEWKALEAKYVSLGFEVETVAGHPELPDMVFAANQSFPFWSEKTQRPAVLMSRMRSEQRKPEVAHFRKWYEAQGYEVHELDQASSSFEGNGDALLHPGKNLVWGGFGPRTDARVYDEISTRFGFDVIPLRLTMPEFYHLDTCFAILDDKTVAIQPKAFDEKGRASIRAGFENVIELDEVECLKSFAGNCHSPDGRNVLLQRGCARFVAELRRRGFTPHELETREYMKSGGSVFCMKMMVF